MAYSVISGHIRKTPVITVPGHTFGTDASISLKLELMQHSGSFKARGATHALLTREVAEAGVAAASGGNHGVAVAWAAKLLGHEANIFVPTISAETKVERLRSMGATIHQVGAVYSESLTACEAFQAETGATSVHAYNDPVVVAGAGTCMMEFEQQVGEPDIVVVACGGGGLAAGTAAWLDGKAELIMCETETTTAFAEAKEAGHPVAVEVSGVAADALGATSIGDVPWSVLKDANTTSVLVTDEQTTFARNWLWTEFRILVEHAAAVPIAALLSGRYLPPPGANISVIVCGANTGR